MPRVIPPSVEPDDEYFWAGVAEHRLLIQECADCHTLRHPPLPMCGHCHSTAWTTRESAGSGRVHSWVRSVHPGAPTEAGRIVVLVELDEGVRFVDRGLFRAEIALPTGAPTGVYRADILLFQNGVAVSRRIRTLTVEKVGLERALYVWAHERPWSYGLAAMAFAMLAGWAASAAFRRD